MDKTLFAVCFVAKHGDKNKIQSLVLDSLSDEGLINIEALQGGGLIPVHEGQSLFLYSDSSELVQAKVIVSDTLEKAKTQRDKIKAQQANLIHSIFDIEPKVKQLKGLILSP